MRRSGWSLCACALVLCCLVPTVADAATEQQKQAAIDKGLAYLIRTQRSDGSWYHSNNGTTAATASAAMAFIEEGYLPDQGGTAYEQAVYKACNYVLNQAYVQGPGGAADGIYFWGGSTNRNVYTTGLAGPMVYALGNALGKNTTVGMGNATASGLTYYDLMSEMKDWWVWGQNADGGWRYYANYGDSDNSTAQWGGLGLLQAQSWGISVPQTTLDGLMSWVREVQHDGGWYDGASGYDTPNNYLNVSKTGGLLLELDAVGAVEGTDTEVDRAIAYIDRDWNQGLSGWYGNIGHPYAMWAVYKGLQLYGYLQTNDNGTPGDPTDDFAVGTGIPNAQDGITIGQDWAAQTAAADDWYAHYCDWLVNNQTATSYGDGYWAYSSWEAPLTTGWYVNILNASPVVQSAPPPIPEPMTLLGVLFGVSGMAGYIRRRRAA